MHKPLSLAFGVVGLTVVMATACWGQQSTANSKSDSGRATRIAAKVVSLTGRVTANGKSLITDKDGLVWNITNPDALADTVGIHVVVRAVVDAVNHAIEVMAVRIDTAAAARLHDAAFRR